MRRQIEAIEDIVEGDKPRTNSKQSGKKASRVGLSIEHLAEVGAISSSKLETPKETNAMTSTRKIFDLSAQNPKGKENLDSMFGENPSVSKQGSSSLQQSLENLALANPQRKNDLSTLSKTPPHNDNQLMMQMASLLSPMLFRKKQESRF